MGLEFICIELKGRGFMAPTLTPRARRGEKHATGEGMR
jgi:hypothetical protein